MWGTPASRLLAPPTAAALTNGSGTPASANPVSEHSDGAGSTMSGAQPENWPAIL